MTKDAGDRPRTIDDVDFGRLYREHFAASGSREKPPEAWDARAADLSRELDGSPYVDELLRHVDLTGCRTLLDVGCGPGAVALALAPRLDRVYGLDYSRGMLDAMTRHAAARGLGNVEPILRSLEDDWSDVPACDLVVASRSTLVRDMEDALARLDSKSKRRVCLTSLVGGRFVRADVLALLGRERPAYPDYIYILNLLHRMGRHPRLDYIRAGRRSDEKQGFDQLVRRVEFSLGSLTEDERQRLEAWYREDPERAIRGRETYRWAFVSWETGERG
ncbi:MAG: class I SAM-dependent methyltransferase [Thermoanaerobaculia bacterium]